MKFPIMLVSTHENVVAGFESKLTEKYNEMARNNDELAVAKKSNDILQNRNCELNVKLAVAENKIETRDIIINKLEDSNNELHLDIVKAESRINLLEQKLAKKEEENKRLMQDNVAIVNSNKRIFELKRQLKEKIDIACKYVFLDKQNGQVLTRLDASKLTKKDIIECYTLLGLM